MSSFGQGAQDSIRHIFYGVILSALISAFRIFPAFTQYGFYLSMLNALVVIILLFALTKMSYGYIIGWIGGVFLLIYAGALKTGLITISDLAIAITIPIVVIVLKLTVLNNNPEY